MKRIIAFLLIFCVLFQTTPDSFLPVNADTVTETGIGTAGETTSEAANETMTKADEKSVSVKNEGELTETEKTTAKEKDIQDYSKQKNSRSVISKQSSEDIRDNSEEDGEVQEEQTGAIGVEVTSALPIKSLSKIQVSIKKEGNDKWSAWQTLSVGGEGISTGNAQFRNLAAGKYTIRVHADKFAEYTQDVKVFDNTLSKIIVYSAKIRTGDKAHPGWILIGDVNRDKTVDAEDKKLMLNAIHANTYNEQADLDSSGTIDLLDLQYLVQSLDEHQESTVEQLSLPKESQGIAGTRVEGNLEQLLEEKSAVKLSSMSGGSISESNPVGLEFTLSKEGEKTPEIGGLTIQAPYEAEDGILDNDIASGTVLLTYDDGQGGEGTFSIPIATAQSASLQRAQMKAAAKSRVRESAPNLEAAKVTVDAGGSLVVNFGTQIAVKKVSIKITGTRKNAPLVEIAKVEFVNGMEDRIPAPELDIPEIRQIQEADKELTVTWTKENNVTGYEVSVTGPTEKANEETQIVRVAANEHRITAINNNSLKNFKQYIIKVRSVNGDWMSPWSEEVTAVPRPLSLPAPPDNVKAEGRYLSVDVSWKNMDDSEGYMVYYRKKDTGEFKPVIPNFAEKEDGQGKLTKNKYTITGLENNVEYEIYVKGWNRLGWGRPSLTVLAETEAGIPPQLPNYQLINTPNGEGELTNHITNATIGGSNAKMVGSPLDEGNAKGGKGLVDNSYSSYWMKENWDDGGYNEGTLNNGMIVTFDKEYQIKYFTFAAADQKVGVNLVKVRYWNEKSGSANNNQQTVQARLIEKKDANGNVYYIVLLNEKITANKIHMRLGRNWVDNSAMKVGEMHFHQADEILNAIENLFTDDTHTVLRDGVNEAEIDALQNKLDTPEETSKERHPLYKELKLDLDLARDLVKETDRAPYEVNVRLTAKKDAHLGFGGLNAWQPLGKTVYEGETLTVYVGHSNKVNGNKLNGNSTELQLVVTQNHAEYSALSKTISLKVGRNDITVPRITTTDTERGGQMYIAYTGNSSNDKYSVRVQGGTDIPVLNLYGVTGEERTEAITTYIKELQEYQGTIKETHTAVHTAETSKYLAYDYDEKNCILNVTDIQMDEMMYSLPATQVWKNIKGSTIEEKAAALDRALKAMEDTMTLFYQHKGLSNAAGNVKGNNARPVQHLNIRYMRMFAGAFMYAANNHIGIEWGSASLTGATQMESFGWGIAHEIGHNINQGSYDIEEVTNNYFAQLLTGNQRFKEEDVYKKVTSGAVGRDANVFTQLALYWQLHLAFDNQTDDRHIYDEYTDIFNNIFFARVDTYSRNPSKAPKGTLTLDGNEDQNLMRLACAAAEKNILYFFERWGMVPDEKTKAYGALYESETKAYYYANAEAREYRTAHIDESTGSIDESTGVKDKDALTAKVTNNGNQANIAITAKDNINKEAVLGYEIIRSMTTDGHTKSQVVGFQPADENGNAVFADTISSINNRVMTYEVKAVDKFLNYSNAAPAGSVKIETEGILSKEEWTVTTTMISDDDILVNPDEDDPDSGWGNASQKRINSIERILDNDKEAADKIYNGKKSKDIPQITIDMHKTESVTALKYMGTDLSKLTVEISANGKDWVAVKENYNSVKDCTDKYATVWFDSVKESEREHWIGTYDARYVRLTLPETTEASIKEIEICGPSGDNLEFMTTGDGQPSIGVLKEDYQFGTGAGNVIPKGSLIFTGKYKGNPAYNMVILYDEEGNVIGAKDDYVEAEQVIFADVPEQGNLGTVSDGTWVYYVKPDNWTEESVKNLKVRGELYRVDDALTLEGERVVSDTLLIDVPDILPDITLTGKSKVKQIDVKNR